MFGLPLRILVVLIRHIHHLFYIISWGRCPVCPTLVCPQHVVQHHALKNNVSDNPWSLSMMPSRTRKRFTKIPKAFSTTLLPGDPLVGYSFFPCQLPSAAGFDHTWHQGEGFVTQQEEVWPSLPQGFRWWKPQAAVLDLLPKIASVENLCIRVGTT